MKPWPIQPRDGFTGFQNAAFARAIGLLTAEQFRLFGGLVYAAEFKREGSVSPCGRWRIGYAQVLVSYEGLAEAYGMKVDAVRCAASRGWRRSPPPAAPLPPPPAPPQPPPLRPS